MHHLVSHPQSLTSQIQHTMHPFQATILTITHRVHKIVDSCDKVIVMEDGRVAEFDTPDILAADRSSLFYAMLRDSRALQT